MTSQPEYTTLINCTILTVNEKDDYYSDGCIILKNNFIHEIGNSKDINPLGQIIDMNKKLVMPGLINTHAHSPASLFRGLGDDLFLEEWLRDYMWPAEENLTADLAYSGAALSYLEFLHNGMTTNVDMWYFTSSVAKAVERIGLRGFIAAGISTDGSIESFDSLESSVEFIEKYIGKEASTRVYPCIGPHDAYSCSRELLKRASTIASKYGILTHIHLSETSRAHEETKKLWKITPAEYMEQCGIFEHPVLAAHCIFLEESDMHLFKEKGVSISYNPVSNLKLCDGIMPLKRLQEHGIKIGLGVDGAQSNNSLDLLSDIKTGSLIQKMAENDPTFFPAREAIRMITIEGAKTIGMQDKIGSLEVGKLADVIALDLNSCNLSPCYTNKIEQLYSHIIYSATGKNVSDVWVDGEHLLKDKQAIRVNKSEVISEAQFAADFLLKSYRGERK